MRSARFWAIFAAAGTGLVLAGAVHAGGVKYITGAGSTFAYPLYSAWADQYARSHRIELNYQSIGSGGGIQQIKAGTVDFGASDAPLKMRDLKKFGLVQFPTAMGGVIPAVNIRGVKPGSLVLSGPVLAGIFIGRITRWNNPEIQKLNPNLQLPNQRITVVHRSDGSGTTFIFTNYLAKVSPEWKSKVGFAKAVAWPVGIGGKGNEGVAAYIQRIPGSIGYNEYAYVLQNHMNYADMINRAGKRVAPTAVNFAAAAANADWKHAPGYYLMLTNQPGAKSWPITGATFLLVHARPRKPKEVEAVLEFFHWGYTQGRAAAEKLDYIPLPAGVVKMVEQTWNQDIRVNGRALWPAS